MHGSRIQRCLEELRRRASGPAASWKIHVWTENNFPTAAGLASSASGLACFGLWWDSADSCFLLSFFLDGPNQVLFGISNFSVSTVFTVAQALDIEESYPGELSSLARFVVSCFHQVVGSCFIHLFFYFLPIFLYRVSVLCMSIFFF